MSAQAVFAQWQVIAPEAYCKAHKLYLLIDFSNGCMLSVEDVKLSPEVILGLRLAFCYFGPGRITFPSFRSLFAGSEHRFTVAAVLSAIKEAVSAERLYLILHIDEVQKIFEQEEAFPTVAGRAIFKQLMYVI